MTRLSVSSDSSLRILIEKVRRAKMISSIGLNSRNAIQVTKHLIREYRGYN